MFFIFLLVFITIFLLSVIFSRIEINVKEFNLILSDTSNDKFNFKYYIEITVLLLNKIRFIKLKINNNNIKKWNLRLKKISNNRFINNDVSFLNLKNIPNEIKDLKLNIKNINLNIKFGLENAANTAIIIGILSTFLAIITNSINDKTFRILPVYDNKNILKIDFNCIFYINVIHYIYIKIIRERRKTNERKSSYRRSYAYNNE